MSVRRHASHGCCVRVPRCFRRLVCIGGCYHGVPIHRALSILIALFSAARIPRRPELRPGHRAAGLLDPRHGLWAAQDEPRLAPHVLRRPHAEAAPRVGGSSPAVVESNAGVLSYYFCVCPIPAYWLGGTGPGMVRMAHAWMGYQHHLQAAYTAFVVHAARFPLRKPPLRWRRPSAHRQHGGNRFHICLSCVFTCVRFAAAAIAAGRRYSDIAVVTGICREGWAPSA